MVHAGHRLLAARRAVGAPSASLGGVVVVAAACAHVSSASVTLFPVRTLLQTVIVGTCDSREPL